MFRIQAASFSSNQKRQCGLRPANMRLRARSPDLETASNKTRRSFDEMRNMRVRGRQAKGRDSSPWRVKAFQWSARLALTGGTGGRGETGGNCWHSSNNLTVQRAQTSLSKRLKMVAMAARLVAKMWPSPNAFR